MNKLLTVSVAAYNVEKYLRNTLDSLLIDELTSYLEVFVIDDGGWDESLNIAREYEKKYPGVFFAVHKEDNGYGSTVNYSIAHATGRYFKILDGDDWFDSDNLKSFINKLLSTNLDIDMIITPFQRFYEGNSKIELVDETIHVPGTYQFDDILSDAWFTMHAITYKTEILKMGCIHLSENCFYADSEYNLLPLRNVKTIMSFNDVLYCYRLGLSEQSVSPKGIEKHYKDQEKVLKRLYDECFDSCDTNSAKNRYIYNYLVRWTNSFVANMLIITKSKIHKNEIVTFINYLRDKKSELYDGLVRKSNLTKALIYSDYHLYGILHVYMLIKSRKGKR